MLPQENTVSLSELKAIISERSVFPKDLSFQKVYLSERTVLACRNAPGLRNDLSEINLSDFTVIAADGAAAVLMDVDIVPEVIYTDLDGNSEADIEKSNLFANRVQ
jgi:2-amino-4-hydroxy-6-hydroxymethyldihydropteridine diphosphokinase